MLHRSGNPDISTTAFSIARQFTGPPFSHALESAALRMKLLEEMDHPAQVAKRTKKAKPAATQRPAMIRKPAKKQ
jgi:hypothetical protein